MNETEPLSALLRELQKRDYQFVAVTPATHARVLARPLADAPSLRDIFGWNRPFATDEIDEQVLSFLRAADAVCFQHGKMRSKVRVASLGHELFLHSSFPTNQPDSVFFGPDTYRFASFVQRKLPQLHKRGWIVDMGSGSGAGGIIALQLSPGRRLTLVDINPLANRLCAINAAFAGTDAEIVNGTIIPQGPDLVIANPPYMMDKEKRAYRDGGDLLGGAIALEWANQALSNLAPGGTMLLYTGAAYRNGRAPLIEALNETCARARAALAIEELDPDVFGEELDEIRYSSVERIAAIGAVIVKAG